MTVSQIYYAKDKTSLLGELNRKTHLTLYTAYGLKRGRKCKQGTQLALCRRSLSANIAQRGSLKSLEWVNPLDSTGLYTVGAFHLPF